MQRQYQAFISSSELYGIVTEDDKSLYSRKASRVADPSKRRELKIAQYKQEKELRTKIEVRQFLLILGLPPTVFNRLSKHAELRLCLGLRI